MKTLTRDIILIIVLTISLVLEGIESHNQIHHYEVPAIITEATEECVTVVDNNGEAWEFEGDGYEVGQMVIVVFNDMKTKNIYDDEIIEIRG